MCGFTKKVRPHGLDSGERAPLKQSACDHRQCNLLGTSGNSKDILIKTRACPPYYNAPYPITSRVPHEISRYHDPFYRVNNPNPLNIIIRCEYPKQTQAGPHSLPPEHLQGGPVEKRKLLSSVLTLPGMLADKLVSGEIAV